MKDRWFHLRMCPTCGHDDAPADPTFRQIGEQASPLKRLGTPKDIADVVAFVVSEEARWLTGQNIHAGGGVVM